MRSGDDSSARSSVESAYCRIGDHVLLAPPFIVTEPDVDEIVDRLATSNQQTIDGLSSR
jgi:adenosylmethionine-8-amino-7-oxononanoate aminotransferase